MSIVADKQWSASSPGAYRRTKPVRLVVWHWTGGKTSEGCVRALKSRGLSVHYTIDHDGTIREHADPLLVVTQHVGQVKFRSGALSINAVSVGIEIAHKGLAPSFDGDAWRREEYVSSVHGKSVLLLRFAEPQVDAARWLARHLSERLSLPLEVPRDGERQLRTDVLDEATMRGFCGHAGHYHFAVGKTDPGPELLREIVRC